MLLEQEGELWESSRKRAGRAKSRENEEQKRLCIIYKAQRSKESELGGKRRAWGDRPGAGIWSWEGSMHQRRKELRWLRGNKLFLLSRTGQFKGVLWHYL